jgi:crossover junction endodeoxyribonuclease RuvC
VKGSEGVPLVVGIDLSLTGTGLATSEGICTRITSAGKDGDSWPVREMRMAQLCAKIENWIWNQTWNPQLLVIEGPAYSSNTGHVWDRAGLWWWCYRELPTMDCPIVVVPPNTRAVYATGKGNAGKPAVVEAVTRRWGHVWGQLGSDDVADACVLAAMGCHAYGMPLAEVPESHARALASVDWGTTLTDPATVQ